MSAEELLVLLNSNITLICIAAKLLNLFCSNLLYPLKMETTRMTPFQHQCFQVYFEFMFLLQFYNALIVWKITLFSHDKVVVAQFQARRWFYALIHAKWLPLIWEIKTKQCCICGNGFISFDKVLLCCLFFNHHAWWPFYTKYIISHYLLYYFALFNYTCITICTKKGYN